MLIPIGHEDQRVTRLPWVTILLVLANVAVFLLTNQLVQQQAADTHQRLQGVVRYAAEHPYLRVPPEIQRAVPSAAPRSDLDPGTVVGDINFEPEQTLGELSLRQGSHWDKESLRPFSQLDPIVASELIRDLEGLRS